MFIDISLVDASLWVPIAVLVVTAIAVFTDLKSRRIPNWLTVTAVLIAFAFHLATGGWIGLASSFCGFASGFGVLLILFLIGGGGGGDVKLMGAVGSWIGAFPILLVFVGSAVFVILIMIGVVVAKGPTHKTESGESIMRRTLPYAVPMALALISVLLIETLMPIA